MAKATMRSGQALPSQATSPAAITTARLPMASFRENSHTLRANKRETITRLKFTLEGAGERTHGYAFTDPPFAGCRI